MPSNFKYFCPKCLSVFKDNNKCPNCKYPMINIGKKMRLPSKNASKIKWKNALKSFTWDIYDEELEKLYLKLGLSFIYHIPEKGINGYINKNTYYYTEHIENSIEKLKQKKNKKYKYNIKFQNINYYKIVYDNKEVLYTVYEIFLNNISKGFYFTSLVEKKKRFCKIKNWEEIKEEVCNKFKIDKKETNFINNLKIINHCKILDKYINFYRLLPKYKYAMKIVKNFQNFVENKKYEDKFLNILRKYLSFIYNNKYNDKHKIEIFKTELGNLFYEISFIVPKKEKTCEVIRKKWEMLEKEKKLLFLEILSKNLIKDYLLVKMNFLF